MNIDRTDSQRIARIEQALVGLNEQSGLLGDVRQLLRDVAEIKAAAVVAKGNIESKSRATDRASNVALEALALARENQRRLDRQQKIVTGTAASTGVAALTAVIALLSRWIG